MFFPKEMTEVELIVPSKDLLAVAKVLSGHGIFHQVDSTYLGLENLGPSSWQEKSAGYSAMERRIQTILQTLNLDEDYSTHADFDNVVDLESIRPAVERIEEDVKGTGGGVSFRGINVGGKKQDAYMAVDLRVIDTTTGEVEFTRTVEARASGGGLNLGLYRGGFGCNLSKHEKTPTGKAIRAVIMEISEYLSCAMVDQGDCMAEYQAKESSRREKTKKAIKLD